MFNDKSRCFQGKVCNEKKLAFLTKEKQFHGNEKKFKKKIRSDFENEKMIIEYRFYYNKPNNMKNSNALRHF